MFVTYQVIRQSVLTLYDSVAISMHIHLLTCNRDRYYFNQYNIRPILYIESR